MFLDLSIFTSVWQIVNLIMTSVLKGYRPRASRLFGRVKVDALAPSIDLVHTELVAQPPYPRNVPAHSV